MAWWFPRCLLLHSTQVTWQEGTDWFGSQATGLHTEQLYPGPPWLQPDLQLLASGFPKEAAVFLPTPAHASSFPAADTTKTYADKTEIAVLQNVSYRSAILERQDGWGPGT